MLFWLLPFYSTKSFMTSMLNEVFSEFINFGQYDVAEGNEFQR